MNRVEVEIDELAITASDAHVHLIENAVETILKKEAFFDDNSAQVTVLLTGDARLRQLNRDFAGEDHVTDVLSFGVESVDDFPDTKSQEGCQVRLGDIAISIPQTVRQASQKRVSFERELAMLAIHGALHLMGYDHIEQDEERTMFGKTDEALNELFSTGA